MLQAQALDNCCGNQPVQHPMLDRVRSCSATPEAAASFFTAILHPYAERRLSHDAAAEVRYLADAIHTLHAEYAAIAEAFKAASAGHAEDPQAGEECNAHEGRKSILAPSQQAADQPLVMDPHTVQSPFQSKGEQVWSASSTSQQQNRMDLPNSTRELNKSRRAPSNSRKEQQHSRRSCQLESARSSRDLLSGLTQGYGAASIRQVQWQASKPSQLGSCPMPSLMLQSGYIQRCSHNGGCQRRKPVQ